MKKEPFYEDPAANQESSEIEQFLRSRTAGDEVAIHNSQGGPGMLEIKIAKITERSQKCSLGAVCGRTSLPLMGATSGT